MARLRLVELCCETEEARQQEDSPSAEWCDTEILWIGEAEFEDFASPSFLERQGIAIQQSDGILEWHYYVEELERGRWHVIGYPLVAEQGVK